MFKRLKQVLDWVSKEDEVIEYMLDLEERHKEVTTKYNKLKNRQRNLYVCPEAVRGYRYDDILIPDWVQWDDMEQLGKDFSKYLNEIAPYRRP